MRVAVQWLAGKAPVPPRLSAGRRPQKALAPERLPYQVELWNAGRGEVETVLAMATTSGIAYAAFHAAIVDYPDRYITLRIDGRTITSANAPAN